MIVRSTEVDDALTTVSSREQRGQGPLARLAPALIVAGAILIGAWLSSTNFSTRFDQPYQAVLLANGQVYYGKLEGYGTRRPVLKEVYYIQTTANGGESNSVLLKRGHEWHGPDQMYLNPSQILLVENVGPTSRVADLIRDLRTQP